MGYRDPCGAVELAEKILAVFIGSVRHQPRGEGNWQRVDVERIGSQDRLVRGRPYRSLFLPPACHVWSEYRRHSSVSLGPSLRALLFNG